MTPEERREHGRRAVNTRWGRDREKHYARLRQIGEAALKAHTDLVQEIRALQSTKVVELEHHVRRLITAYANLWEFSGHNLPRDLQDYAAGVVDELQRQARDRRPFPWPPRRKRLSP